MKRFVKQAALLTLLLQTSCAVVKDHVFVTSGTVLGFSLAQNPATQLYEAKLGYGRMELGLIPTNTNGVPTSDVMFEVTFGGLPGGSFSQRLAVGTEACQWGSKSLLFARDSKGRMTIDPQVAKFLSLTNVTLTVTNK